MFKKLALIIVGILLFVSMSAGMVSAQDGRIEIPSLEITADIVPLYIRQMPHATTWDTRRLNHNVGFLTGTGWFGQNKNVVLGGHSELPDRQPSIFYTLQDVEMGAIIQVHTNDTIYNYVVTSLEWVDPSDLSSVLPTGHDQLTLITCDTNSYDDGTYEKRLIVRALPA